MGNTAMRRTTLVLLVAALCVAAGYTAFAGASGSPAVAPERGEVPAQRADEEPPEIGTAILLTRNPDGSITTTER